MDKLFEEFLQNVQDLIYSIKYNDDNQPELEYISHYITKELGYPADLFKSNPMYYYSIIHPADIDLLKNRAVLLTTSKKIITTTYRIKHNNSDKYTWIEEQSTPIYNKSGKYVGYLSCGQNINYRKEIESELKITKDRLKLTFDTILNGIVVHGKDGLILDYNIAAKRILGLYTSEHLIGQETIEGWLVIDEDGLPILKEDYPVFIAKRENRPINDFVMGLLKPDESILWLNVNAIPLANDMGIIESFTDITERKNIEISKQKLKAQLYEALRISKLGTWDLDYISNQFTWSNEIYTLFEKDPSKVKASYEVYLSLIHPKDRKSREIAFNYSLENFVPSHLDHRLLFEDGRIKYVHEKFETFYNSDGKPTHSVGTIQDITERKLIEIELKKAQDRLKRAFDTLNEGIIIQNHEGIIIECNSSAEAILERPKSNLIGKGSTEYKFDAIKEDGSPFLEFEYPSLISLNQGKSIRNVKMGLKINNSITWVLINTEPLVGERGVVVSFSKIN